MVHMAAHFAGTAYRACGCTANNYRTEIWRPGLLIWTTVTNPLIRETMIELHFHHKANMRNHFIVLLVLFPKVKTQDALFHYSLDSALHVDSSHE
jgi:hypothetical protein